MTKKRFSKKINYAAIDNLFRDDKAVEDDAPLLGMRAGPGGKRSKVGTPVRAGTPILMPRPTFGSSRAETPSRLGGERPAEKVVEEEEEEEEDEEEEEEVVVVVVAPQVEEPAELEEWRVLANQNGPGADEEVIPDGWE